MKKRIFLLLTILCLSLGLFALPVSADSMATSVDTTCTVDNEGNCSVFLKAVVHLEVADKSITFPLPANATNIKLNGSSVTTVKNNASLGVYLDKATGGMAGDFVLQFSYDLPKSVKANADRQLVLTVPLLSGFSYPIENYTFVVNLQGDITERPDFYSTYRQNAILSALDYNIQGGMISGAIRGTMNDHEALTMTLIVPQELFPSISTYQRTGNPEIVPMAVIGGIALVFWLLFLRAFPPFPTDAANPPEGLTAGELENRLTMGGGDLTMMVLSWAELGYLLIQMDGRGRVLLYKRMEMGNERSLYEIRVFNNLFSRANAVDATGSQYAKLCRKTAEMIPGQKKALLGGAAGVRIFRLIGCASFLFCGICMAMNLSGIGAIQVLLAIFLGALGLPSAWLLQGMAYRIFLRSKARIYVGLGVAAFWLVIGFLSGYPLIPLCEILGQILAGFLAAYGGRRSELNKADVSQIMGLRRYLKSIPASEIPRILSVDPDFFFRMLPYAMALGVEKPFCKSFGDRKLPQCPYMAMREPGKRSAEEWSWFFGAVVRRMDRRYRRMQLDKWLIVKIG